MEKLADLYIKLVTAFQEAPIRFVALILLMIGALAIYTKTKEIAHLFPSPYEESIRFEQALQRDLLVNQALESTLLKVSGNFIMIDQFHNGQHDLTRLPFTKVSTTYYSGATTLNTPDIFVSRPLSSMNRIMLDMWKDKQKPVCISKEANTLRDPLFRERMLSTGTQYVSLCPLTNVLNYPIGYVIIGFEKVPSEQYEVNYILATQRIIAERVAGYLQDGKVISSPSQGS